MTRDGGELKPALHLLMRAEPAAREAFELSRFGIHWEALDEDVSVAGLLAGRGDCGRAGGEAA